MVARNRALARAGVVCVGLVHNLTCEQPTTRARAAVDVIETAYLRGLAGVVSVCRATQRAVDARRGQVGPSAVAEPGRDHLAGPLSAQAVKARAEAPGPLSVLFLAQVAPHKGLHRLLAALARVPRTLDVHLEVVGSLSAAPSYAADLRRVVSAHDLTSRVTFRGELRGTDLLDLMRRCHVLALPSDREAYPISVVEALGQGMAVLLSDRGGTSEVIRDGLEGRLLSPHDVSAWASAIAGLANDRARLRDMGLLARTRFAALGTWGETASSVRRVLVEAVAARRAGRAEASPRWAST
jgi:glycosyltransferase involved in cell wall biosynthesis